MIKLFYKIQEEFQGMRAIFIIPSISQLNQPQNKSNQEQFGLVKSSVPAEELYDLSSIHP